MSRADAIEQCAAEWLMRHDEPGWSDADAAEFEAWLDQSPGHQVAYWRLEQTWSQLDRAAALPERTAPPPRRLFGRAWHKALLPVGLATALAASLLVTVGPVILHQPARVAHVEPLRTAVGQQGNIELADGSKLMLNTDTSVRVSQDGDHREIWLDRGETYLEVKHDPNRPFIVHVGDRAVTVLGTKFAVFRQGDKVTVAVLQGRVRLDTPHAESDSRILIDKGAMAIADHESTLITTNVLAQIERRLRWRTGMISLENATLEEAAAQFNRYHQRKLVITDPAAAKLQIGGSFKIANVEGFARLLHEAYGLNVKSTDQEIKVSEN